nr:MAG TPA: hypothetical protein [Caudoviricetes sp.]
MFAEMIDKIVSLKETKIFEIDGQRPIPTPILRGSRRMWIVPIPSASAVWMLSASWCAPRSQRLGRPSWYMSGIITRSK